MRLSRSVTVNMNRLLDDWLPPMLRDCPWLLPVVFRALFKGQAGTFQFFKERAPTMSDAAYAAAYRAVEPVLMERPTDASEESIQGIRDSIVGETVLEVGCGRGYLAGLLAQQQVVTATDMHVSEQMRQAYPQVTFQDARMEQLPFPDASFDTVVCAHTLEHAPYIALAVAELRRVTRRRLVIVVPAQRPYRYTFDLHLHFFPYPHSLLLALNEPGVRHRCEVVGGDLLYIQDCA